MKKNDLLKKFSEVENKLINELKKLPANFSGDENLKRSEIESYIKKVNSVKAIFEDYESLATQISGEVFDDGSQSLANDVVDLRENDEKEKTVVETEFVDGEIKTKTKKVSKNGRVRE